MVAPAAGTTLPEIAERYKRSRETVRAWTRRPGWPAPLGRRGRFYEYDAAAVDAVVRAEILGEAPATTDPGRLLTDAEVAERAGVELRTLTGYIARGQWIEPDDVTDGVRRWRQDSVDRKLATRKRRRDA
jgi:uncharacterized protein YjcR